MTMMNRIVIAVGILIRGTLLLLGSVFWPRSLRHYEQIISVFAARDCCEHIIHFAMPGRFFWEGTHLRRPRADF